MKVKDMYWQAGRTSTRFANLGRKRTRPLPVSRKCPRTACVSACGCATLPRERAGGAIVLLSRHEAAVLANAIDTRSNWIGEKTSDMPRIGVSVTETSTIIRFMECEGAGHIALPLADGERLASWLYDYGRRLLACPLRIRAGGGEMSDKMMRRTLIVCAGVLVLCGLPMVVMAVVQRTSAWACTA